MHPLVIARSRLLLDRVEASALPRGRLGMADRVLDRALAIGVAQAGRVGDDARLRERRGVQGVEFRCVEIALGNALLEVIERDVPIRPTEAGPGRITILDDDILAHFRSEAKAAGIGYQTMNNVALRDSIANSKGRPPADKPLTAATLRKIPREGLQAT